MPADRTSVPPPEPTAPPALAPAVQAWLEGGAEREHTLHANVQAWQRLQLWPRVLRDLGAGSTATLLAGRKLKHPILVAPMALQRRLHADGELGCAMAAAAQGAGFVLSTQTSTAMDAVAQVVLADAGRGPLWFQLYWQAERSLTRALVQQAEAAGYEAIVLTVDAPVQGLRDREQQSTGHGPDKVRAVHLPPRPTPVEQNAGAWCGGVTAHAPTWDDVTWLQNQTRLPVWLKGILHPLDARQAQQLKVAGIVVSNHGGRTLDTAPATAAALPRIRAACGPDLPLVVDGGIRRGSDVLKAMALGANAVMLGRPVARALAAGGALAVAQTLKRLRDELEMAMALAGCATLAQVTLQLLSADPAPNATPAPVAFAPQR